MSYIFFWGGGGVGVCHTGYLSDARVNTARRGFVVVMRIVWGWCAYVCMYVIMNMVMESGEPGM